MAYAGTFSRSQACGDRDDQGPGDAGHREGLCSALPRLGGRGGAGPAIQGPPGLPTFRRVPVPGVAPLQPGCLSRTRADRGWKPAERAGPGQVGQGRATRSLGAGRGGA